MALRLRALSIGLTGAAAMAVVFAAGAVPATTGCTTHQCDTSSTTFDGGFMVDDGDYVSSAQNQDWVDYPGEVTVHVLFPAGVTRMPTGVNVAIGTESSPNGGLDYQVGGDWTPGSGQLALLGGMDTTGVYVTNGSCAHYWARVWAVFPPVTVTAFGGLANGAPLNDTWSWDGTQWQSQGGDQSTGPGPAAREMPTFLTLAHYKFLFGGFDPTQSAASNQGYALDTWTWDGASWTQIYFPDFPDSYPSARADTAAASLNGTAVMFGGHGFDENGNVVDLGDTWTWDGVIGDAWALASTPPAASPPARSGASAATLGGAVILFGGSSSGSPLGDTWSWDGTSWTQVSTGGPPPRFHASMVGLGTSILLFGGDSGAGELGDTWLWDGTSWTQQTGSGPPARAQAGAAAYKTSALVFGGTQASNPQSDTWLWAGGVWSEQSGAAPPLRAGAAVAGTDLLGADY
ncbi:MAG TPA: hypothetical protein VGG39_09290 [Polyangiaceae bacterium]|jgi:hypothetical protein